MIPALLGKWYTERKELQAEAKRYFKLADAETDAEKKAEYLALAKLADQRQLAKKILLNSLYGALLNVAMRFYDERLGQSTTLTGRSIVRHMNAALNAAITGLYDFQGAACYYADTDSAYISAYGLPDFADFEWSDRAEVVKLYDAVADAANASFPDFMARTFNTTLERGSLIKAGRELIASKALFIKKKKYAALVFDQENQRLDVGGKPGKIKAMGLDLKRADTPKFMQEFLERVLMGVLTGVNRDEMYGWVREFRVAFQARPGWEKGSPKKVNGLANYGGQLARAQRLGLGDAGEGKKVNMPGHVRAALNWNRLREMHGDRHAQPITDASRVVVCKLRPSTLRMDSVAHPVDEPHLPSWFRDLPFDHAGMEDVIVDQKLLNLVGPLGWDMTRTRVDDGLDDLFGAA